MRGRLVAIGAAALVLAGGTWFWLGRQNPGVEKIPSGMPAAGVAAPAAPSTLSPEIPAGKGSLNDAGKFTASTPSSPPARTVTREEAEAKLHKSLKIEELSPGKFRIGRVNFDKTARTVAIPAKVNQREGIVEYVLTTEAGKRHEALLTTTALPQDMHLACLLLGMKGAALSGGRGEAMSVAAADAVEVSVTWETNGPSDPMPAGPWHYTGSRFIGPGGFAAQAEGSFIALIRDDTALLNNPGLSRDYDDLHVPNAALLPAAGAPVTIICRLAANP